MNRSGIKEIGEYFVFFRPPERNVFPYEITDTAGWHVTVALANIEKVNSTEIHTT